ncbi:MAG TPA: CPXCG motif-containing cysteine-rich protein [Candidatus Limnocylindria bacterium]|nr:CPXCG motif-containing cysteine-rich protein [Candidatus Limnocylindria bacterium]
MQASYPIECPYCGQRYDLVVDASVESQSLITDCEICCRPCEVHVECEMGEVVSAWVEA